MVARPPQTPYVIEAHCTACGEPFAALAWRDPDGSIEHSEHCEACLERFIAEEAAFAQSIWSNFYERSN